MEVPLAVSNLTEQAVLATVDVNADRILTPQSSHAQI
jgi:hypothetical protein